jgi:hypothetical protein
MAGLWDGAEQGWQKPNRWLHPLTPVDTRGQGFLGSTGVRKNAKTPVFPGFFGSFCFQSLLCYRYTIPQIILLKLGGRQKAVKIK